MYQEVHSGPGTDNRKVLLSACGICEVKSFFQEAFFVSSGDLFLLEDTFAVIINQHIMAQIVLIKYDQQLQQLLVLAKPGLLARLHGAFEVGSALLSTNLCIMSYRLQARFKMEILLTKLENSLCGANFLRIWEGCYS